MRWLATSVRTLDRRAVTDVDHVPRTRSAVGGVADDGVRALHRGDVEHAGALPQHLLLGAVAAQRSAGAALGCRRVRFGATEHDRHVAAHAGGEPIPRECGERVVGPLVGLDERSRRETVRGVDRVADRPVVGAERAPLLTDADRCATLVVDEARSDRHRLVEAPNPANRAVEVDAADERARDRGVAGRACHHDQPAGDAGRHDDRVADPLGAVPERHVDRERRLGADRTELRGRGVGGRDGAGGRSRHGTFDAGRQELVEQRRRGDRRGAAGRRRARRRGGVARLVVAAELCDRQRAAGDDDRRDDRGNQREPTPARPSRSRIAVDRLLGCRGAAIAAIVAIVAIVAIAEGVADSDRPHRRRLPDRELARRLDQRWFDRRHVGVDAWRRGVGRRPVVGRLDDDGDRLGGRERLTGRRGGRWRAARERRRVGDEVVDEPGSRPGRRTEPRLQAARHVTTESAHGALLDAGDLLGWEAERLRDRLHRHPVHAAEDDHGPLDVGQVGEGGGGANGGRARRLRHHGRTLAGQPEAAGRGAEAPEVDVVEPSGGHLPAERGVELAHDVLGAAPVVAREQAHVAVDLPRRLADAGGEHAVVGESGPVGRSSHAPVSQARRPTRCVTAGANAAPSPVTSVGNRRVGNIEVNGRC
jgi:hypothetical protein